MSALTEHLQAALDAVAHYDKDRTVAALGDAFHALPDNHHPARYWISAAQCSADISNWAYTSEYLNEALRHSLHAVTDPYGLTG